MFSNQIESKNPVNNQLFGFITSPSMEVIVSLIIMFTAIMVTDVLSTDSSRNDEYIFRVIPVIDQRSSYRGRIDFTAANNGVTFQDLTTKKSGCIWPRNSENQYINGCGIAFAAQKKIGDTIHKVVVSTYDLNSGISMAVPGRIEDGLFIDSNSSIIYQVYISNEYNRTNGEPKPSLNIPNWPLWHTSPFKYNRQGDYILDLSHRFSIFYPEGPAFISDEEVFCIYKDTDLRHFGDYAGELNRMGLPLGLQYEQAIFSYDTNSVYNDILIIQYNVINMSADTLLDCWLSPVIDVDITSIYFTFFGIVNDRSKLAKVRVATDSLPFCAAWTDTLDFEANKLFGYVGFAMIQTPAIATGGWLRHDKPTYRLTEQLGLKTFCQISPEENIYSLEYYYDRLSAGSFDSDTSATDQRLALATGAFNMLPGDTARIAMLVCFAQSTIGIEPNGSQSDLVRLGEMVARGYRLYYDSLTSVPSTREIQVNHLEMAIYPNPASDYAYLDISGVTASQVEISVYDIIGIKCLATEPIMINGERTTFGIDCRSFSPGIYFAVATSGGSRLCQRFVVVR